MNNDIKLAFTSMTEQDGREICDWRYPAPYELFKWPSWESMMKDSREFADERIRREQYMAARNGHDGQLVGYVQLFPMDRTLRIGMGLRPDCCDRGWGRLLTELVVQEARRREPGMEIDLEVEKWNRRAIKVYEKAGFVVADEYERRASHGIVGVFCMVWHN
ncbi:GNAT family N-acetyltransferase [Cohnella lupini]|uniref:Acetyltransferase (GNAT) family protein n=1 Tax=Cohnella lupini TaxID=1294267 RepID=A0A3D9HUS0_9BACL|nr:GNAT family N-acetyltransferase [Cohnella lupini]RED53180.1 acetyltransferase (GNAT) family protein [Cohnella lupini]